MLRVRTPMYPSVCKFIAESPADRSSDLRQSYHATAALRNDCVMPKRHRSGDPGRAADPGLQRIGPFVQLDRCAPRVVDERQFSAVGLRHHGPIELDAGGFKLLHGLIHALYVEPDVIEHAPERRDGWLVGLGERQLCARDESGLVLYSGAKPCARLRPEMLDRS